MSEDPDFATVVGLLDDEHVRTILTIISTQAMSAAELSERTDASLSTVYRRLERLEEAGLVAEGTRPRTDGHHDTVYRADLDELTVRLRDGEFHFELDRRSDDVAARLAERWRELGR